MSAQIILKDPAIPLGSTVLVTGVNGLLGSHIANQFLAAGYNVRGTVRSAEKNSWMRAFFKERYANVNFELCEVRDMAVDGSFDEAVRGCSGVIHTTSSITLQTPEPEPAISENTKTVLTCLESATAEKSVKRFVLTSSAWAISAPRSNTDFVVSAKDWNEQSIQDAYAVGTPASNPMTIFMGAKTIAEKESWKFVKDRKPAFVLNTVNPDTVFGAVLDPEHQGMPSTSGLIRMLFKGQGLDILKFIEPQYFCDAADQARLHVGALIHPSAANERFVGHADRWNWNDILKMFREWYPDEKFPADMDLGKDISTVEDARSLELLKDVYGQDGWTSLEHSIRLNVDSFVKADVKDQNAMFGT